MEAMISLNCLEDCLTLAKYSDYVSTYKDNVLQQLHIHKAQNQVIDTYENAKGLNCAILEEVVKRLKQEPSKEMPMNHKGIKQRKFDEEEKLTKEDKE